MTTKNDKSPEANEVYVGPRPFRTGQKLYGRDRESRQLVSLIISQRLVLLHSPSGAGKTSLIHAKVVPALEKRRFEIPRQKVAESKIPQPVVVRVNRSLETDDPADANRYVLSALLSLEMHRPEEERRSAGELAEKSIDQYLEEAFPMASLEPGETNTDGETFRPLLLLLDQFEELLTLDPTDRQAKREFLSQLGVALENEGRWALFSIREDFLGALDPYLSALPNGLTATYHLDPLPAEIAAEAIKEPAREAGVTYEEGVVEALIDDLRQVRVQDAGGDFTMKAGPSVEPVHLQVVCQSLWQVKGDAVEIRHEHLEQLGEGTGTGIDEVLGAYYSNRVRKAASEGGVTERRVRDWFGKQLIGTQKVRRPILVNEAIDFGMTPECLDVLDKAFLIRRETRSGAQWYELAHDRLMDPVVADNEHWRIEHLSQFQIQAELWNERGRPNMLLLSGEALGATETEIANGAEEPTETEIAFLEDSRQADLKVRAEKEQERQVERIRKLRKLVSFGATALLILAGLTILAFYQKHLADKAEREADWAAYSGLIAQAQTDLQQGYIWLASEHLGQLKENYQDHLGWEHRYLMTLFDKRDDDVLIGHNASVTSVAQAPDESCVASGSIDMTVRLWDVAKRAEICDPFPAENWIRCVAFNHDGTRIACGTDQPATIIIWDAKSDSRIPLQRLTGHADSVRAIAFGPASLGNRMASGSVDGTVRFWDTETGKELLATTVASHKETVTSIVFDPNGKWVASGGEDGHIRFWNVTDKKEITTLENAGDEGQLPPLNAIALSPGGNWITAGDESGYVRFWNIENLGSGLAVPPKPVHSLFQDPDEEFPSAVTEVAFRQDGTRFAAGYYDGMIRESEWKEADPRPAWNDKSRQLIQKNAHQGAIAGLVYPPNQPPRGGSKLLSGGVDCLLRVSTSVPTRSVQAIREPDIIWRAVYAPDGKEVATANADGEISLYSIPGWQTESIVPEGVERPAEVWWVAYSPDGNSIVSGGKDLKVRLWDRKTRKLLKSFTGHKEGITCVAFNHRGDRIASSSEDRKVMLWDPAGDESQHPEEIGSHEYWVTNVAFSKDDKLLVSSSQDKTLKVWDLTKRPARLKKTLGDHKAAVQVVVFSKDGKKFASGGADDNIIIWDSRTLKKLSKLEGHAGWVTSLAFHPDGTRLASGSEDNTIKLWELESGRDVMTLKGHLNTVWSLDFSPDDGTVLLSAGEDRTLRTWKSEIDKDDAGKNRQSQKTTQ